MQPAMREQDDLDGPVVGRGAVQAEEAADEGKRHARIEDVLLVLALIATVLFLAPLPEYPVGFRQVEEGARGKRDDELLVDPEEHRLIDRYRVDGSRAATPSGTG
jgi:hypothetical protein